MQVCSCSSQAHLTNATGVTENYFIWRVGIISLALDTDDISSGFIHWSQGGKTQHYIMHTTVAMSGCTLPRNKLVYPTEENTIV